MMPMIAAVCPGSWRHSPTQDQMIVISFSEITHLAEPAVIIGKALIGWSNSQALMIVIDL